MKKFILLLNHDDISLSAYLQHCLAHGERFVKASGNSFTFCKTEPTADRLAVVTYANDDPDLKMKFQMEDYAALMKTRGWKVICTGKPEDIFDSKRHVFLQTSDPEIPFPNTSPELAEKAKKHEVRSCIRCFAMLLILLGFAIFFLGHDLDVLLSSAHILLPCAAAAVLWVLSLISNIRGAAAIRGKTQSADGFRNYLAVDRAVLYCLLAVVFLLASLLLDVFLFPDTAKHTVFGDQRITVYQDSLPLTLEDLSIPVEGLFRSSRLTERNSFLMRSLYGSDQSFSDTVSSKDLSLISYSLFHSNWKQLLVWTASQKGAYSYPVSEELAVAWHSTEVRTDGHHRLFAFYPDAVLVFAASTELSDVDPEIILQALSASPFSAD